jgi:hypothetical protein
VSVGDGRVNKYTGHALGGVGVVFYLNISCVSIEYTNVHVIPMR